MPFQPGDYVIDQNRKVNSCVCQILSAKDPLNGKYAYDMYQLSGQPYWVCTTNYYDFDTKGTTFRLATTSETPSTPSPVWAKLQAVQVSPHTIVHSWKVGEWYGPPVANYWIGRIVGGPNATGNWKVLEYDLKTGKVIGNGLAIWVSLAGRVPWTAPFPTWVSTTLPSAVIVGPYVYPVTPPTQAAVTKAPVGPYTTPVSTNDTSKLVQFFAGNIAKKPKGMPPQCLRCHRNMSATMDQYYGMRSTVHFKFTDGFGARTNPANLCSTCRPRGC
jgi:hypothetical protein